MKQMSISLVEYPGKTKESIGLSSKTLVRRLLKTMHFLNTTLATTKILMHAYQKLICKLRKLPVIDK